MALTTTNQVDLLFKKLFGYTRTSGATSTTSESISSPVFLRGDNIWLQANQIPSTPSSLSGIVTAYTGNSAASTIAATAQLLASTTGVYQAYSTGLKDWIPPEFNTGYAVSVYVDTTGSSTPTTTGTQIFPDGTGGAGQWVFDYQAGVLNFIENTLPVITPAFAAGKSVFIVGYRYVGTKGVYPSQTGNSGKYLTTDGTNVSWGSVSGYSAPTLGSTSIASGATVSTISGLTLSGATLTGSLTAGGSTGTSGYYLQSTGTGVQWAAASGGSGSGTTTNALTIGTGLSGTSFNGSSAVTIAIDSTVATLTGSQTLTNKTYNGLSITANSTGFTLSGGTTAVAPTFAGGAAYTISGTNNTTITLPATTGTLALNNQTFYIGSQAIAINAGTGTITALPGVTSVNGTTIPSSAGTLMANPMTTAGDIIYGGTSGTPTRLAGSGTNGWVLTYNTSTNAPVWVAPTGGSGSGNTIENNGTTFTAETNLNFVGLTVVDNPGNSSTDVFNPSGLVYASGVFR
jgi:hypothetical protein